MNNLLETQTPKHIAIIMDGNGRWAKSRNKPRIFGHKNALGAVRSSITNAAKIHATSLTLFAFSSENINRPQDEIFGLFELFLFALKNEVKKLDKNNIKLRFIGDLTFFNAELQQLMKVSEEKLKNNTALEVIIALNYGGKWDIINACNAIDGEITEQNLEQALSLPHAIDLLIRTGGEKRLSNFLLWQCAYAELYFTDTLWPDFNEEEFTKAIQDFGSRERRFGKI